MLTSKAWRRRLAHKCSALGIVSTLVLLFGATLTTTPAQAATAVDPLKVTYRCTGGALAAESVVMTVTTPESIEPSKTGSIKWTFPAITATKAIAAQAQVTVSGGDLTVTGGTPTPLKGTGSGTVSTAVIIGGTYTPPQMTATVTATASTGGYVVLGAVTTTTPATLTIKVAEETTECTYVSASPTSISVPVKTGTGTGTGIVAYVCDLPAGTTETDYPADVNVKVTMTVTPTSPKANDDVSISWTGAIQTGSDPLKIPTGFPATGKFFATVKASGAGLTSTVTSAEGTLSSTTVGQTISSLPTVTLKVKPTTTGTVTLTPADLYLGASATSSTVKCTVKTGTTPDTTNFTVAAADSSPSASPTTPKPTTTKTVIVTKTPVGGNGKVTKTPKAGAETGGGGDMGPDGRMFVLVGSLLVLAAGVGGLFMRRRTVSRG